MRRACCGWAWGYAYSAKKPCGASGQQAGGTVQGHRSGMRRGKSCGGTVFAFQAQCAACSGAAVRCQRRWHVFVPASLRAPHTAISV